MLSMTMMITSQGSKWAARRSSCERPRTYDKFYQKTPGNFQVGLLINTLIIIVMAMLTTIITIVTKTTLSNQVMHNLQPADERDSAIFDRLLVRGVRPAGALGSLAGEYPKVHFEEIVN